VKLQAFLTWALDGGEWSASWPDRFIPGEGAPPHTHWMGPRGNLDVGAKSEVPASAGNENRVFHSLALVTILTELSRLLCRRKQKRNPLLSVTQYNVVKCILPLITYWPLCVCVCVCVCVETI
jgi:hypothetical protein